MPNLTKDVGFIRSFWPLYEYTYTGEYIGDVGEDEGDEKKEAAPGYNDESDSNESGKSAFEFVDKNKDDWAEKVIFARLMLKRYCVIYYLSFFYSIEQNLWNKDIQRKPKFYGYLDQGTHCGKINPKSSPNNPGRLSQLVRSYPGDIDWNVDDSMWQRQARQSWFDNVAENYQKH